jgi:protein-S-isoprenylcysteine O-methyltransferase Ste14
MEKLAKRVSRSLQVLAMCLVPLLVGWGVDDLGGFAREPARVGFAGLMALGSLAVLVPRLNCRPCSQGSRTVGRWLLRAWMASGLFLGLFLPFADRRSLLTFANLEALRSAGLLLCLTGAVIRVVGLWFLGKQFSGHVTLQKNHQLVQTGIYRCLRHPLYLGAILVTSGMTLVFRSWLVIPVSLWTLVFVLLRIQQEERLLAEHFGNEFESYRQRTWRLLPYVY